MKTGRNGEMNQYLSWPLKFKILKILILIHKFNELLNRPFSQNGMSGFSYGTPLDRYMVVEKRWSGFCECLMMYDYMHGTYITVFFWMNVQLGPRN